ncbi:DUF397 domain-containing protein [Streptomyces sp. NBC_00101]|uniref:DUF397 domain-containing protein n=1 Tax=Streptomyces sp. NBC_00101 TaxID=2975651 RepID=UPI0032500E85
MAYRFAKSSYSTVDQECVEVALNTPGSVAVRDSKRPGGPLVVVAPATWAAFGAHVRHAEGPPSR